MANRNQSPEEITERLLASKIDGYLFPPPRLESELDMFLKAKMELYKHLAADLVVIDSMTLEQFKIFKKEDFI